MRVVQGCKADPDADRDETRSMLEWTVETGIPSLRVWCPHQQLAFGRRDTNAEGYASAREIAASHGFTPVERDVGGHAVAYSGSTVAFANAKPIEDIRQGIGDRYDVALNLLQRTLWRLGIPAQRGEPPAAFCPGDHSLSWHGKIAGVAQHITKGAALVGGIVVVSDHEAIAGVLDPVYDALDVPFDPESVGSLTRGGVTVDQATVIDAIESAFVGDREPDIERVE